MVRRRSRAGARRRPPISGFRSGREVRSASTSRYDIGAKKAAHERAGLPELWLVDTAADEVLVFRRSSPQARDGAGERVVDSGAIHPESLVLTPPADGWTGSTTAPRAARG